MEQGVCCDGLFLLVILCCCFELDIVVREGALIAFVLWFCDILIVCCFLNFVVIMGSTPPPPCTFEGGGYGFYCNQCFMFASYVSSFYDPGPLLVLSFSMGSLQSK